jgi:hypothetical protein
MIGVRIIFICGRGEIVAVSGKWFPHSRIRPWVPNSPSIEVSPHARILMFETLKNKYLYPQYIVCIYVIQRARNP